jgi:hypothetical protein
VSSGISPSSNSASCPLFFHPKIHNTPVQLVHEFVRFRDTFFGITCTIIWHHKPATKKSSRKSIISAKEAMKTALNDAVKELADELSMWFLSGLLR